MLESRRLPGYVLSMPVSLDDLAIPSSGQFFKLSTALTDADVNQIFDDSALSATGPEEARDVRIQFAWNNSNYFASFVCFPIEGAPAFLPNTNLSEKRFAFMLLLEIQHLQKWYLGIFKSGISVTSERLDEVSEPLPRRALTRAFGSKAVYEKLSLRRMTVSRHELRASSYEAANLAFTLPMLATTRSVPRHLRLEDVNQDNISITVGTSRIHRSGSRY